MAPLRPQPANNQAGSSTCKKRGGWGGAESKPCMQEQRVSEQVRKLQRRRKRQVPLILFTEKGNRMDRTAALRKLEASESQLRTRTTTQDHPKKAVQLGSLPSATSAAQDRGTGLGEELCCKMDRFIFLLPTSFQFPAIHSLRTPQLHLHLCTS